MEEQIAASIIDILDSNAQFQVTLDQFLSICTDTPDSAQLVLQELKDIRMTVDGFRSFAS